MVDWELVVGRSALSSLTPLLPCSPVGNHIFVDTGLPDLALEQRVEHLDEEDEAGT